MSDRKVILAAFNSAEGTQLEVDGHFLEAGKQYEVTAKLARRLEDRADCTVIRTAPGGEGDERPVTPEGAPVADKPEDAPILIDEDPLETPLIDPNPLDEDKE